MKLVRTFAVLGLVAMSVGACAAEQTEEEGTGETSDALRKIDCHDKNGVRNKCIFLCRSRASFSLDRATRQAEVDIGVTCTCDGGKRLRTSCFDAS